MIALGASRKTIGARIKADAEENADPDDIHGRARPIDGRLGSSFITSRCRGANAAISGPQVHFHSCDHVRNSIRIVTLFWLQISGADELRDHLAVHRARRKRYNFTHLGIRDVAAARGNLYCRSGV
jgi:hypothetical protein